MAATQPPLQYAMQTDVELESKLCEKGLKGDACLRSYYRLGSTGFAEVNVFLQCWRCIPTGAALAKA